MQDQALVLGINRTQDASACLARGSGPIWAIQKERLSRHKHHWGRVGDFSQHYGPRLPGLDRPIDVLVECFSSDAEIGQSPQYESELAHGLALASGIRRARISHHLAHLYSAFHPSPFDEAAVLVIDGQGSAMADFTEPYHGPGQPHWRELASFYFATRAGSTCIAKQLWDLDERTPAGLGMFYFLLANAIFPGEGTEGKVMGLAPHGNSSALGLPPLEVEGHMVHIPPVWLRTLAERERFRYRAGDADRFVDAANLAAAGQQAFEQALWKLADWLHRQTGMRQLCFAGGTALNCPANEGLLRHTPFERVFVPPAPGDAGTAIGCALYGLTELADAPCTWRWQHDYLGPRHRADAADIALKQAPDLVIEHFDDSDALCAAAAAWLAGGNAIALYQDRSEFGPRALGHRSILADPRDARMRDWINAEVKEREWFRPLAPVVLQECASEYFELDHPSPFMQFAVQATVLGRQRAPAIVHVDGSARVQTVSPDGDLFLRTLMLAFAQRTGLPVLLNTSLNRRDEPIVETVQEALATFRATPLQRMVMPPYLIRKRASADTSNCAGPQP